MCNLRVNSSFEERKCVGLTQLSGDLGILGKLLPTVLTNLVIDFIVIQETSIVRGHECVRLCF